ncbi:MAG: T9SS type A sorting domain-containing protein [Bacteroidales bacterium]|nr:T9SS type A sorting domain-containing protein [Bacteroidales bacterium]
MLQKTFLFILFLLLFAYGFAQENWVYYNHTNVPAIGPIDNMIHDITTDTSGNLWFATQNGLSKFDGTTWEQFLYVQGYLNSKYNRIIIDKENTIWLSLPYAFGGFFRIKNNNYEKICEGKNIYNMAIDTAGHIWVVAHQGLFEYTGNEFIAHGNEHELLNENLYAISFDKNNKLCVGTFYNGILYKNDTAWINFTETDGLINNNIIDIDFDNENNLWIATDSGVSCYNGIDFTNYTKQDGLCSNEIQRVYVDNEDYVWFTSYSNGLSSYKDEEFITYNTQTGLKDNFIRTVFKDTNKGVWITYNNKGVDYLINDTIINYSGNGIYHIECIFEAHNNNIWVGTMDGGINVFDGSNWETYNISNGFIGNHVYTIVSDNQQNIWISTLGGLAKYDGNEFEYITIDSLPGKYILTLYFDKNNDMWLGTAKKGAVRFNGEEWTVYDTTNSPIIDRVDAICEDNEGNIWFGTSDSLSLFDGIICKFDGNNWTTYHPIQGKTQTIYNDSEGNLWFGLITDFFKDTTILKYDGENWETILLELDEPYTYSTDIFDIAEDKDGNIWFGRDGNGVSIYKHGEWQHKYPEDGYPESTTRTIMVDHTGDIWFGSWFDGIYKIDYPNDIKNIKKKEGFKTYPNPVKDILYIQNSKGLFKTTKLELYDINGKLLFNDYYHVNYELNMSKYSKGVYIIKLKYFNNIYTEEIVKE